MSVVVVGAGLAGLAAACHLRGSGYDVTLLERDAAPGGRAGRLVREGFTFDTGPTVMTMPDLVAEPLAAVGAELASYVPMRRLDPGYRARYADGTRLDVPADLAAFRAEIARLCGPGDADAFDEFVAWTRRLYELELPNFIDAQMGRVSDLLARPAAAAELLRLGAFGRLGPAVARRFADERLHRLFSFQSLYAGVAPADALALYAVITYMDCIAGVWHPEGGMGALPAGLARAAVDAGVEVAYGASVRELLRDRAGRVAGVRLADGTQIGADAVVCTLDLPTAYRLLLPDLTPPRVVRTGTYSPSCVVWHVGVRGLPGPEVAHHNIHFGRDWDGAFRALIGQGRIMPDPSRLVSVPTLSEPSLAPEGCSTLYVLEPVPHLQGRVDWHTERGPARERLAAFLAREGYPHEVVVEEFVDPLDWERAGMHLGTPFALAHRFTQTGPFRPGNVDRRVPGLVFAGSGTIPGVGVPMVLISGKLAAQRVREYLPHVVRPRVGDAVVRR